MKGKIPGKPIEILLTEDNPGDFRFIQEMFKESKADVELKWAKQLSTGLANLKEEMFDGVLVDLGLPDSQGIDTFKKIHDQAPQIPYVVLTGLADDGLALRAVREGAQDYLVKGQIDCNLLIRAIHHAIERKRAEEALKESELRYRSVSRLSSQFTYSCVHTGDDGYEVDWITDAFFTLTGYSEAELHEQRSWMFVSHPDDHEKATKPLCELKAGESDTREFRIVAKDGQVLDTINYMECQADPEAPGGLRLFGAVQDITERKQAEEALRGSEEKYRTILENIEDGYFEVDIAGNFTFCNDSLCRILGYSRDEMIGMNNRQYTDQENAKKMFQAFSKVYRTGEPDREFDWEIIRKDGTKGSIEASVSLMKDPSDHRVGFRGIVRDITEHKRVEQEKANLEEQLRQSQKIEAIGRLAGGIAHDFNNLLTVIKGYSQFSLTELPEASPLKGNLEEIQMAADRAADLTRQLLAFSRRQVMEMRVLDLNAVLENLDKMLRRVIGEDIELVTLMSDELGRVKTDPGQMEQVVINLAVNAKDAMVKGGKLTVETANVELDETYARAHIAVKPGRYVMLSVSDMGVGMTPEVRERVFEPFFTTKEKGKGTGLGLSTVYGIVKQSGGNIWVYSELGKGTTVKIYLPRVEEPPEELGQKTEKVELRCGNETILVAEDNEEVRKLVVRILQRQGYMVLGGSCGNEAINISEHHQGPIHLLVTDVVMPQMSGRDLAEGITSLRPETKVLYMSGYTDDAIVHHGVLEKGMNYLQKPFTLKELARRVREILDK